MHSKTWTGAIGLSHGAWIPVPSLPYLAFVSQSAKLIAAHYLKLRMHIHAKELTLQLLKKINVIVKLLPE